MMAKRSEIDKADPSGDLRADTVQISRRRRPVSSRRESRRAAVSTMEAPGVEVPFDNFELSLHKIILFADYLHCPGERVRLRIRLSSTVRPLEAVGEVVHAETGESGNRPGMTVVFCEMEAVDREELERFLRRR